MLEEEDYDMSDVTSIFADAVAKIKDLINYGGEKPVSKNGLLKKEDD